MAYRIVTLNDKPKIEPNEPIVHFHSRLIVFLMDTDGMGMGLLSESELEGAESATRSLQYTKSDVVVVDKIAVLQRDIMLVIRRRKLERESAIQQLQLATEASHPPDGKLTPLLPTPVKPTSPTAKAEMWVAKLTDNVRF